jgi:DNA primase
MLLALMGKYPEVIKLVNDFGPELIFRHELKMVADGIITQAGSETGIDWTRILDGVDSPDERSRLASLFIAEDHLEDIDVLKAFEQCRRTLARIALQEIKGLSVRLSQTEPESEAYHELLKRIDCLRARKSQLK